MKIILGLLIAVSAQAFASEKYCEGAKNDSTLKGESFTVNISEDALVVNPSEHDSMESAGTYKRDTGPNLKGKDGKTYYRYNWGSDDGCGEILVNETLLQAGGEGWLKFRCRGEGFSDNKYFCRDSK